MTAIAPGRASALILRHGSLELRYFAPEHHDPQTPHDRDELYVIASGKAIFVRAEGGAPFSDEPLGMCGEERVAVGLGDAVFVPAGRAHRFEEFSDDFSAWMIFYGPEGGERA